MKKLHASLVSGGKPADAEAQATQWMKSHPKDAAFVEYLGERGLSDADARLYARHMVIGKFAEAQGLITYWMSRQLGRRTKLIEYKTSPAAVISR